MLHLASRIPFGVDIRDLLELEGPLERQGVVEAAAQIKEVVAFDEALGDPADGVALLEHDRHEVGQLPEPLGDLAHERRIDEAPREAQLEPE